jgi:hypothetical protein
LSSQEKKKLNTLLDKHRFLFKGTLRLLPTKPVHIEIKSNAKPFHGCTFSVPFEIYTDALKCQIGSVITQKDKPLAFYSRKLTDPQTRYTVTELELLAIVETLCEYKCILLGHLITQFTPITRTMPFQISLLITSLAGD